MRMLLGFVAAVGILTSLSGFAEAGRSRSFRAGEFFGAPGGTPLLGSEHPALSHHRHGSSIAFQHRARRFFRSEPFVGTIVPPLRGTIVPPFQIGSPFHRDRVFSQQFDGFFFSGSGVGHQIIIILQPVLVPVEPPIANPRAQPQIVVLDALPQATGVQVFTPSETQ